MKRKKINLLVALGASLLLVSCGETNSQDIVLNDSREDYYTVVSGEYDDSTKEFVEDGDTKDFKSLYEASNYLFDNCENGSYVKLKDDAENKILFQKRANKESINGNTITDQWFYYKDGTTLDAYSIYLAGDTNFYVGQKYTRMFLSNDSLTKTYQPYSILKRDSGVTTQAWNLLPLLDTSIRYNPIAFSGMREVTYKFNLTESTIRPSYNETQKVVPTITLSQTDSYNWSNQGIYMDTATGNWYYLYGETQSDSKNLKYDDEEVILTSTWNNDKQEFTPNGDVEMTLKYVQQEDESWRNDLIINVTDKDGKVKTFNKSYEQSNMNGRGTPRCNISMDLVSTDEDVEETAFAPDFMCGAYFKNITISEAKGKVPEGLTDDEYQGDTDMVGKAGEEYNLLACASKNDVDMEVILDHYDAIEYHSNEKTKDVFDISYEQKKGNPRTDEVAKCEELIAKIKDTDTKDSTSVIKAQTEYEKLDGKTQDVIKCIDGYTALEEALKR